MTAQRVLSSPGGGTAAEGSAVLGSSERSHAMSDVPEADRPTDGRAESAIHIDRRYKIFAAIFAVVVLTFAAISIAVVIVTSS